jgi:hypothetical protein
LLKLGGKASDKFKFMLLEDGFEVRPVISPNVNVSENEDGNKVLMPKQESYDNQSNEIWIKKKEAMKSKNAGTNKTKD